MQKEIIAQLRYFRMGPRKVRLVANMIRGKKAAKAVNILSLLAKRPAKPLLKLLKSAIANAKHNHNVGLEELKVYSITVDGGPTLKRWMPKAHGRATPVRERTSHIKVVLTAPMEHGKEEVKKE